MTSDGEVADQGSEGDTAAALSSEVARRPLTRVLGPVPARSNGLIRVAVVVDDGSGHRLRTCPRVWTR